MATAGDRHESLTGNIWNYAHRGDLTGLKAALLRNSETIHMKNTVGWTALHAAASGGQTKAVKYLLKTGADPMICDNAGQMPMHHAAKQGHVQCLKVLGDECDLTNVRLSQTKGQACRELVLEALKKSGKSESEEPVVGYSRKQAKSTAFWGPRKTPISGKIKKNILKQRRQRKQEKEEARHSHEYYSNKLLYQDETPEDARRGYHETVKTVKQQRKAKQNARRQQHAENDETSGPTITLPRAEPPKVLVEIFEAIADDDESTSDSTSSNDIGNTFNILDLSDDESQRS